MKRTLVLVAIIAGAGCARQQGPKTEAALSVRSDGDTITVTNAGAPSWRAVVDRKHGGVISAFHLPADGPNLVASDKDASGKIVSHFRGLFSAFYSTHNPTNPAAKNPRGTLWLEGNDGRVSVIKQSRDEVVIEVKGAASGWARVVPADERMVEYRQTYTFRRDRIGCDGELTWVYPHETRMLGIALHSALASEQIAYPVLATQPGKPSMPIPLASSGGQTFPAELAYPMGFQVRLMNGYAVEMRSLDLPPLVAGARRYALERPWQQSGAQTLGWYGSTPEMSDGVPAGQPQHYAYELLLSKLPPEQQGPRLTITSPARDADHRIGETIQFAAEATDAAGHRLAPGQISWAVYHHWTRLTATYQGDRFTYTLPPTQAQLGGGDIAWVVATATDSAGRTTRNYVGVEMDFKKPALPPPAPFTWQTATPESQGLSSAKIAALQSLLAAHDTHGLLIVRNDRIVHEWYAPEWSASKRHGTASMAKGLVGGIATAVALDDGRLGLDDPAGKYVPQWRGDSRKSRITVRQLGSHTSGLDDAEDDAETPHDKLTGWQGDFWKQIPVPHDPFSISRDITPARFVPGERNFYSNPGIAMLAYTVTAALKDAPQKDLRTLLRDRVMRPIGITDDEWSAGYEKTFMVDGLPLVAPWGGAAFTPRAAARLARLTMREGDWDGRRVLRPESIRAVVGDAGTPGNGGIGWWSNQEGDMPELPKDAYWAAGAGHQVTIVIPSLNLIVVRNGRLLSTTESYEVARRKYLFAPLMEALGVDATGTPRGGSKHL